MANSPQWTNDQWHAITLRGSNMLVAAAAGSGKTAVLVERIIRRIIDESEPVDVDRLLVATFTNVAASEMKQRIRDALEKQWAKNPGSAHLRRQLTLIHRAHVTTLHSFCLDVIGRHFSRIGLDPSFRIANETETELMRQDVLDVLLEDHYGSSDAESSFWTLVDWFGGERSDDGLYKLIQKLYDESRSHPYPDVWLDLAAEAFAEGLDSGGNGAESENTWFAALRRSVVLAACGAVSSLESALERCRLPGGPLPYAETIEHELAAGNVLLQVAKSGDWDDLHEAFRMFQFGRLKRCRPEETDKLLQEQAKAHRDAAKAQIENIRTKLFQRTSAEYADELAVVYPIIVVLTDLVKQFGAKYRAAKQAKGLVDFADLEHYALDILRAPDSAPGAIAPSEAAKEYQELFVEVLIDEYQDTNEVQEAILTLISLPGAGNRFMVGDVKQSIYRFRLAEPGLFMAKYKSYRKYTEHDTPNDGAAGTRIDLARNFRSRGQIVDAVNTVFAQLMTDNVAEMTYDEDAMLVLGASYPDVPEDEVTNFSVDAVFIDRSGSGSEHNSSSPESEDVRQDDDSAGGAEDAASEADELETAQLEARMIAAEIHRLMGGSTVGFAISDKKTKTARKLEYRDIVILLRSTAQWTPVMLEELRLAGIPAYAESNSGYFQATEVEIIVSLLRIIDNPFQDIPLAAVLRSPIYGFSADDLARIRYRSTKATFYEALLAAAEAADDNQADLQARLQKFLEQLDNWRKEARQGSLADLIWMIYRETGYYDFVGGLAGGAQRQANLRVLYDRSRQYEATSFRGLFRFLRFIERMRNSGGDLGTARALGEQEDVVKLMSIHKSKGLEYPVVFVAGLGKKFNMQDLNGPFLFHRKLGFGPRFVDANLRIAYPTLPQLAIQQTIRMESLAEEMRILYVAMTRAKEKLILVGTVNRLADQLAKWTQSADAPGIALPDYVLARAGSFLDWLGPALIRHRDAKSLREIAGVEHGTSDALADETSRFRCAVLPQDLFAQTAATSEPLDRAKRESLARVAPVIGYFDKQDELTARFAWVYPHRQAESLFAKTSVSEMKRLIDAARLRNVAVDDAFEPACPRKPYERPRFMEERGLTPAERGSVYHAVMQHTPLVPGMTEQTVKETTELMIGRQIATAEQIRAVDPAVVLTFFRSELGERLLRSKAVRREVPFSFCLSAGEVYPETGGDAALEQVMIQGVIDCLFEEEDGLVLVDYKTDAIFGDAVKAAERHRLQIELYARAIETIWKVPVIHKVLFFFDGAHTVYVQ